MVIIMRKITQQAVNAFIAGRDFNSGNTTVAVNQHDVSMRLHGNLIAVKYKDSGNVHITNAGWSSKTTKERLNGILDALNVGRIYQRDFVWYWNGEEFPHNEFVKV